MGKSNEKVTAEEAESKKKPVEDVEKKGWFKRLSNLKKVLAIFLTLLGSGGLAAIGDLVFGAPGVIRRWIYGEHFIITVLNNEKVDPVFLGLEEDKRRLLLDDDNYKVIKKSVLQFEVFNPGKDWKNLKVTAKVTPYFSVGGFGIVDYRGVTINDTLHYLERRNERTGNVSLNVPEFPCKGRIRVALWVTEPVEGDSILYCRIQTNPGAKKERICSLLVRADTVIQF